MAELPAAHIPDPTKAGTPGPSRRFRGISKAIADPVRSVRPEDVRLPVARGIESRIPDPVPAIAIPTSQQGSELIGEVDDWSPPYASGGPLSTRQTYRHALQQDQ